MLVFPFLILSIVHLIKSDKPEFDVFFNTKTSDEVRYLVFELEKYIYKGDSTFKPQTEALSSMKKAGLTTYTWSLISQHVPNLGTIPQFNLAIKSFLPSQTINDILIKGHRQFLLKWAINSEKYHRNKIGTIHHLGGLIDYANYMKREDLIAYINNTIRTYPELATREQFDVKILNIHEVEKSVFLYIQDASRETAIYWSNNLEDYLKKSNKKPLQYDHDKFFDGSLPKATILKALYASIQDSPELNSVEAFSDIIDFRNFSYAYHSFEKSTEEEMRIIANGCEKYNKKQYSISSFKGLKDYLKHIPIQILKKYSFQMMNQHPELNNLELIKDLEINEQMKQYDFINKVAKGLKRKQLILYYLNVQNLTGINTKCNEHINTVFRMKNEDILNAFKEITLHNKNLLKYREVKDLVELYPDSIANWISSMPHIVLADLAHNISRTFSTDPEVILYHDYYKKTESDLRQHILKKCATFNVMNIKDFEVKVLGNSPLYNGLYAYLRAINKETLSIWLNRFEMLHNEQYQLAGVQGSMQSYNEHDKKYYLGRLLYYVKRYPEFFDPHDLDRFVGVVEPHRFVYQLKLNEILPLAYALDAYHRRVSPNIKQAKNISMYYSQTSTKTLNIAYYFIFKMMTIYPELSNDRVLDKVFNLPDYNDIPKLLDKLSYKLASIAYMVQLYYNSTTGPDETDLAGLTDTKKLRIYIEQKLAEKPDISSNLNMLLNGQSDYLFLNYEDFFLRQTKDILIDFTKRMYAYIPEGTQPDYDKVKFEEIFRHCIMKFKSVPEFLNQTLFDEVVNYVRPNGLFTQELLEKLKSSPRYRLIQFALVVYRLHCENNRVSSFPNIVAYINSATKPELIRYISTGYIQNSNRLSNNMSYDELLLASRELHLDIGEQYIYDLSDQ